MQRAAFQVTSHAAIPMSFRVFTLSSGDPLDTVEMHVLAKAYRAAWRAQYASEPTGAHAIERLGVVIDFGREDASAQTGGDDADSPFGPIRRRDWG